MLRSTPPNVLEPSVFELLASLLTRTTYLLTDSASQHSTPQARLAIVGKGPAEAELKQYFHGTNTKFMGLLQGEALSRAYAAADVFVMPSESETLGFVVLEAMASGVPPVCAAAGGLINLVTDEQTG